MIYYYIDIENVGIDALKFIYHEDPRRSKFFIVYTTSTPNIRWEYWLAILEFVKRGYHINHIKGCGGSDSADKHIIAYLACSAAKCPTRDYVVASNDKGFKSPIEHLCDLTGANIQLHSHSKIDITTEEILYDFDIDA